MDTCIDRCDCNILHHEIVKEVEKGLLSEVKTKDLADFFKVFGDPTRIKILNALSIHEMCVCDMAYLLKMKQSAVSHQLRVLRTARLVKYRRDGKTIFYSLDDEHVQTVFKQGLDHIMEKYIG
ncbi:ArsR/SmtB family transcription factor [Clostridium sediminicola]|uniref:ArsR/SmtB family transcription factor n=1 Tax=Clostridium sediminicola TaxID=3114879 RepID=UPI003D1876F4